MASADVTTFLSLLTPDVAFFNRLTFALGDAKLQVHGFVLVMLGSVVGSYGDVILRHLLPGRF